MPARLQTGVRGLQQTGRPGCTSPRRSFVPPTRAMRTTHPEMVESMYSKPSYNLQTATKPLSSRPAAPAFPPIISSTARSADDIAAELTTQLEQYPQALVSGVEPDLYAALRKLVPGIQYQARAKMLIVKPQESPVPKQKRLPGSVCVLSAGPADQPAADQVKVAAEHMGCYVMSKHNISTRDMPHVMDQVPALQAADVVVVIAGIDSCLPGVVAGLVDAPVIAVPTSNGAANGLQGLGNLVAAVSSCAPGVSVVNIDGSMQAAVMAARILRTAAARIEKLSAAQAAVAAASSSAAAAAAAAVPAYTGVANNVVPKFDGLSLPSQQSGVPAAAAL